MSAIKSGTVDRYKAKNSCRSTAEVIVAPQETLSPTERESWMTN
jgi:hypothetical protein